jgi:glycosyltransferase involved in cell wall biosynthesis
MVGMPSDPCEHKPRILAIVDVPGWAHDIKTDSLSRVLNREYPILKRYQRDVTRADLEQADLILVFYWHQFVRLAIPPEVMARYRGKLLCGICSHIEIDGPLRQPGVEALQRHGSGVFVNNLFLYHEFQPLLDIPVYYTPNGVDTGFYRPAPARKRTQKLRVGWAGSLVNQGRRHRGYDDYILPAISRVEGAELVTAVREDQWRSSGEMLEFYQSLDVYLCASNTEGTPNPCLEAAACGIPLVTTRVGNMPELIQDGVSGFLVERNIEDIADKLRTLQQSADLRARMGCNARKSVLAWDWTARAENYRNMFAATWQQRRASRKRRVPPAPLQTRPAGLFAQDLRREVCGRRVAIFGAGKAGRDCLKAVQGSASIIGFIDNAPEIQGRIIDGSPVREPDSLLEGGQDLVLVASAYWPEIVCQLSQMGFLPERDFLVS